MPLFPQDPARLSKRTKQVHVELHLRHITSPVRAWRNSVTPKRRAAAAAFYLYIRYSETLGFSRVPVVFCLTASTRALYEKKLLRLLNVTSNPTPTSTVDTNQYSEEEDDCSGRGVGEPMDYLLHCSPQDVLTEMFPDMVRTPTGISATCRRPIKGAAGRPVQFKYPSTPSSPGTKEREKLQQQLVPVWIQIVVFLFVTSFLYLIYGATTDGLINPFTALVTAWNHNKGDMEEVQAFDALQDPAVPFLAGED
uniref:LEM domain containing 1 n=1 Tax=Scleropages formosus TaxID=113540 RepID=A0A8C9WSH2_SCLFO